MGENDAVKRQGKLYGKRASTSLNVVKYETYQLRFYVPAQSARRCMCDEKLGRLFIVTCIIQENLVRSSVCLRGEELSVLKYK